MGLPAAVGAPPAQVKAAAKPPHSKLPLTRQYDLNAVSLHIHDDAPSALVNRGQSPIVKKLVLFLALTTAALAAETQRTTIPILDDNTLVASCAQIDTDARARAAKIAAVPVESASVETVLNAAAHCKDCPSSIRPRSIALRLRSVSARASTTPASICTRTTT